MLNSLLNNPRNLDEFLGAGGVDLINKIVKNEVDNTPRTKRDDFASPESKFLTKGTICTKTPEQLAEEEKLGINSFANIGLTKEEQDKKRNQMINDLKDDKSRDSTSSSDDKTVQNLTSLPAFNFPDKFLFSEIATILSNKDVKLSPDAIEDLKDLMKLGLSNKA